MRALLTGFLCWLLALQPALAFSPCAIELSSPDGSGTVVVYNTGSSSNATHVITTTQANEPIFVVFFANSEQTSGPAPIVTSVSPLSFTLRARSNGLVTNCYAGPSTCYMAMEVWEALSPSPLAAQAFTVTATSGGAAGAILSVFGVTNSVTPSSPFDSNGSLPAINQQINQPSVPPFVSGVSTSHATDLILGFCGTVDNVSITSCASQTASVGWTGPITGNAFLNSFINYALRVNLFYRTTTSTLSSATLTPQTVASKNWVAIGDAIVCHGSASGSSFPHIWVHE